MENCEKFVIRNFILIRLLSEQDDRVYFQIANINLLDLVSFMENFELSE